MPPAYPAVPVAAAVNPPSVNPSGALPNGDQQPLFTMGQVEELVNKKFKEQRGAAIAPFRERSSHPFTAALIAVRIPKNVVARPIPEYSGGGYPIIHVNKHEASLLGKSDDDNHLALLFPSTLSGLASSWFFALPAGSIRSWSELKSKFLERYMGERQLLKSVVALDAVKQQPGETLADFYGRFHKNVTEIDRRVADGEIVRAEVWN